MFFVAGDYKKCLRSSKIVRPATDFRTESTFASQVSEKTRTCDRKGNDAKKGWWRYPFFLLFSALKFRYHFTKFLWCSIESPRCILR